MEGMARPKLFSPAASPSQFLCCLLLASLLLTTGCVHRQLTIRSEPAGATVMVNEQPLGMTPHAYDFLWYGWHRVRLQKEGYEQREERLLLKAPPYLWIPLDLLAELAPFAIRDTREVSYTLKPIEVAPEPQPPFAVPEDQGPVSQPTQPVEDSHGQGG